MYCVNCSCESCVSKSTQPKSNVTVSPCIYCGVSVIHYLDRQSSITVCINCSESELLLGDRDV